MPVILKQEGPGSLQIGVWEITEELRSFRQNVPLNDNEEKLLGSFKSDQRKREWLAVRALLTEMINKNRSASNVGKTPRIVYGANGKPRLQGTRLGLSISHSLPYAALALDPSGNPGIDIEFIHPRLSKIAVRFLHESEKSFLKNGNLLEQLCVIWCCKESLYKLSGGSLTNFSQNIIISPFIFGENGDVTATTLSGGKQTMHLLSYKRINRHILAYTKELPVWKSKNERL